MLGLIRNATTVLRLLQALFQVCGGRPEADARQQDAGRRQYRRTQG
jgi:hypothetical protein